MKKESRTNIKSAGKIVRNFFRSKTNLVVLLLFLILIITRFSLPETKSNFGYDQVDNAWAVKNIVVEGNYPLVGMQAKGNTGLYIGPYYYYFLVPFYLLTGLDPIASNIAAGAVSIFTFLVTYIIVERIFNKKVAVFAIFITSVSSYIYELDRVQWPVNFVVPISFIIFYSLYKIIEGKTNFILMLAASFGFSLHIHFTSIFYIILILLAAPLIPWKKINFKQIILSFAIMVFFLLPIVISYFQIQAGGNAAGYLGSSFHGFHLRRFIQIIGEGFIEFNSLINLKYALFGSIASFILFIILVFKNKELKRKKILVYLSIAWVFVPWIAFSTYSGELTNYYFAITRPVAILVFSYLLYRFFTIKFLISKVILFALMLIYTYSNLSHFFEMGPVGLAVHRKAVLKSIEKGEKIEFVQGNPQSYLYYYYTEIKNGNK